MKNQKHTPGPWYYSIVGTNTHIGAGNETVIDTDTMAVYEEDARLIASAPELLECLEYCKLWFEKHAPLADHIEGLAELPMLTSVKAAIRKAKGE
jgi:hypothetical protein